MTDDRLRKVEELRRAALERDEPERAAFLSQVCAGDAELRKEVESLIRREQNAGRRVASEQSTLPLTSRMLPLPPLVGKRLGPYEISGRLGAGGMGEVYRAHDHKLGRDVAVKTLPKAFRSQTEWMARFRREARMLASMNHPHIAAIYGLEEEEGIQFLVLELVEGETLAERIAKSGPLPVPEALQICSQVAEALEAAHLKGVTHRDVKPSNIKVTPEGRVKVLDFGLAKASREEGETLDLSQALAETQPGRVLGTPAYMSPEQARGQDVDQRTDIWAFGCLLFELLSGKKAFQKNTVSDTIAAVLDKEPQWSELLPSTPGYLKDLLRQCLQKDPQQRLPDFGAVRAAMGRRRLIGWSRRQAAAVGGVAVLAIVGALGFNPVRHWWRSLSLPKQKHLLVLPFRNIGGDASQQAFCDGLTETLTAALNKHGDLLVVPASDSRRIEDVQQARKEFGVNLVVYGTVQRRGDQVRLTLSLIDAVRDRQIEAEPIDWPVARLYEIEDAVLQKMADLLNLILSDPPEDRPAASASRIPGAHDAYLRGRGYLYHSDREGNLSRALQEFDEAARLDPTFALAYVGQADTYLRSARLRKDPDALQYALQAAERARSLNPRLAAAHVMMGGIRSDLGQYKDAVQELEAALKQDPRDPDTYRELGRLYGRLEQYDQAEATFAKGIAQRPGDWQLYAAAGLYYYSRQRLADAEKNYRKVIELVPNNSDGYRSLGGILLRQDKQKEAEQMLLKAQSLRESATAYANLGFLYMQQHRYSDAVGVAEKAARLAERQSPGEFRVWGNLGDAYWLAQAPPEKAREAWSKASEIVSRQLTGTPADGELLSYLAKFEAKAGNQQPALEHITAALRHAPRNAIVHYQAGLAYALLGHQDPAIHELEAAIGFGYPKSDIQQAPELRTLRENPRYAALFSGTKP